MADISYTPTTWADGAEGGTPVNSTRLNNIEQGIVDAVAAIGPNDTTADGTLKAQINLLQTSLNQIGSELTANWIAESSSAANVDLTASITLTPGKWIVVALIPYCLNDVAVGLRVGGSITTYKNVGQASYGGSLTDIVVASSNTAVKLQTGSSALCRYDYLNFGGIKAIRII